MKIIRVGVDLAKSVFQVHGVDRSEKVVWRKKLSRAEWLPALLEKIEDAEAICEAMSRPSMRFVAVKSVEQQDLQAIHRIRAELVSQRSAKGNQIRGLCSEYGLVAPKEMIQLRAAIPLWLEDLENGLTQRFRRLLRGLWLDLLNLELRVKELDQEIEIAASTDPVATRLQQLRGVAPDHRHRDCGQCR